MQQNWMNGGFSQSGTAGSISPELLLTASLADLSLENQLLAGQTPYDAPHSQASLQLTTDPTGYLVDLGNGQLGLGSLQDLQATTLASSSYGGGSGLQFVTTSAQPEHSGATFIIDSGGALQQEWANPQQVVPIRAPNILGLPPHPLDAPGSHALFGIEAATGPQSAGNQLQLQQQLMQLQNLEAQVQVQAQAVQQRQQFLSGSVEQQHLGSSPGWSLNSSTQVQRLLQSIGQQQSSNKRVGGAGPRVQVPGRPGLGVSSQPNLHQQQQQPASTSALRTSQGRQGSQSTTGKAPGSTIRAQPPSWAGADWNPRAAAQAIPATGTGVFLPRVAPATAAVPSDAASNGSQPNSALNASQPSSALNASQAGAHDASTPSTSTGANASASPVPTSSSGGMAQLDPAQSTASSVLPRAQSAQPQFGLLGDLGVISRPTSSMTGTPSSAAATAGASAPSTASSPGATASGQDRDSATRLGLQPQSRMARAVQMPGGGGLLSTPMTLRLPQVPERGSRGGGGAGGPVIPGTIAIPPPVAAGRSVGSSNMLGTHLMADTSARQQQQALQQQLQTLHLMDGPSSSPAAVMLSGLADGGLAAAGVPSVYPHHQALGGEDAGVHLSDLLPASLGLDQLFPHGLPPLSAASVQQNGHHSVRASPGMGANSVRAQSLADSLSALAAHLQQQQQQQQLLQLHASLPSEHARPSSMIQLGSGPPVMASLNALQQKAMEQARNPGAHTHSSLLDTI